MTVYGDPRCLDFYARLRVARARARLWHAVKFWLLWGAFLLALASTGIVWPT